LFNAMQIASDIGNQDERTAIGGTTISIKLSGSLAPAGKTNFVMLGKTSADFCRSPVAQKSVRAANLHVSVAAATSSNRG